MGVAYLDASAFCKLLAPEPESAALAGALAREGFWMASEVLTVEAGRVALRLGGTAPARARAELDRVALAPLTEAVRAAAAKLRPAQLRALDAIHLATALELRAEIDALYVYDRRLAAAARRHGLAVHAPR